MIILIINSHMLHVWNIYQHLPKNHPNVDKSSDTWSIWDCDDDVFGDDFWISNVWLAELLGHRSAFSLLLWSLNHELISHIYPCIYPYIYIYISMYTSISICIYPYNMENAVMFAYYIYYYCRTSIMAMHKSSSSFPFMVTTPRWKTTKSTGRRRPGRNPKPQAPPPFTQQFMLGRCVEEIRPNWLRKCRDFLHQNHGPGWKLMEKLGWKLGWKLLPAINRISGMVDGTFNPYRIRGRHLKV